MRKRLLGMFLALTILVSMFPMTVSAAKVDEQEASVRAAVEKIVKAHAKKVYQADSDDNAFTDFFVHGFWGNGKFMTLNDKSAMTASLFNANLMQEGLINGITNAIITSNTYNEDVTTMYGSVSWHNYYYSYSFSSYRGASKETKDRIKSLVGTKTLYGDSHYPGPKNANDEVQELLSGDTAVRALITRTETKKDSIIYRIDLSVYDYFDFSGDYNKLANKGYNTAKDQRLKNLGFLLTFMGLDEFNWEYKTSFTIEVPNLCDHQYTAYHWNYDTPSVTLPSDVSNGFSRNDGEKKVYVIKSKDANGVVKTTERKYYSLDETIRLSHDRPWIIEFDWKVARSLQLSTFTTSSSLMPLIYFYSRNNVWLYYTETIKLPEGEKNSNGGSTITKSHYVGVELKEKFKYSSKTLYGYKLENVVAADGSNMIYITVYNRDTDEVLFGPEAMNDHWVKSTGEKQRTLISESSNVLSGKDVYINYIGNKSTGLSEKGEMELGIWENGKEKITASAFSAKDVMPTCTKQGGALNVCAECGYTYSSNAIPALGHSYGEYVPDNNAGCTEDATQTRVCARCGEKDSVAIPNTALGHTYGEFAFDNNASCTEDGTQTRKCTVCDAADTKEAPGTAKGHSYESAVTEPTYTEQGYTTYTCTVCGDSYKDNYVDVKKHSYVGVVTEPTCTAQGFTTYTCSECGDSYVDDYTDMIDHTPVIDPAVKPTCSEKGKTEGSHCGVCGYVIKKQALISTNDNHTMEESIIKMPTYDEPGQLAYICTGCGKADYMEIPPLRKPFENPFTDVTESDWFFEPVLWAVQEGVTGGKTETTFAPNEGCTRAQVVTFLWAANGKPEPTSENPFTDVSNDAWYLKPVLWAVENGITTGVTATEFGPDQTCTRAQIATFLWAANGKPAVSASSEFVDVGDTDWYSTPIIWAKENDVTGGIGDGKFGPNDTCTRAQVVTFLKKVYG